MKQALTMQDIKKKAVPLLKSHGIVRVGLFGSAARGTRKSGSDVDILIETGGKLGLFEIIGLKQSLEAKLDRKVDLVEYCTLKPALRKQILNEQVLMV